MSIERLEAVLRGLGRVPVDADRSIGTRAWRHRNDAELQRLIDDPSPANVAAARAKLTRRVMKTGPANANRRRTKARIAG